MGLCTVLHFAMFKNVGNPPELMGHDTCKGATIESFIQSPGGGELKSLSRTNYFFQPGSNNMYNMFI